MKKAIQFKDVLGNIVQIKTAIDTFEQIKNRPCWIVESRKILPQITQWDRFYPLENHYFETDEKAQTAIKDWFLEYQEVTHKIDTNYQSQFEEVLL